MGNVPSNDDSAMVLHATSSTPHNSGSSKLRQICSFLLGGPMPPAPGLIPLCWEELLDWAEDSTSLTEDVFQRTTTINLLCGSRGELDTANSIKRRIRFVPHVSVHETDAALKKLACQTYMERARFYQESVLVAVEDMEGGGLLCLTTLFQFCRYYSLIRRMADTLEAVLEYPSSNAAASLKQEAPLISPDVHPSNVDLLLSMDSGSDAVEEHQRLFGTDEQIPIMPTEQRSSGLDECVICFDKTEDSVLTCCSHALCSDCERRWVRKRLRCPFCRNAFSSVKEAVQAQWQLSVDVIPIEQVLKDVHCLEKKIQSFWRHLLVEKDNRESLACILDGNYVQRPKTIESCAAEEIDEFVVIQDLLATVSVT